MEEKENKEKKGRNERQTKRRRPTASGSQKKKAGKERAQEEDEEDDEKKQKEETTSMKTSKRSRGEAHRSTAAITLSHRSQGNHVFPRSLSNSPPPSPNKVTELYRVSPGLTGLHWSLLGLSRFCCHFHVRNNASFLFRSGQVGLKSNWLFNEADRKNISSSFLQVTFSLGQARWVSSPAGSRTKLLERAATSSSFS